MAFSKKKNPKPLFDIFMKKSKYPIFSFIIAFLFAQETYDIDSLIKNNGVFTEIGKNIPIEGKIYKRIKDEKNHMGILKNGKKHGRWIEWHPNERRLEENYKNGLLDGSVSLFFKNGQKEWRYNYSRGILNGNYTRWYKTGQKAIDGYYENGKESETWFWWNKNGSIIKKQEFKKKKNGMITKHNRYIDKIDILK
tara:strand:+ start:124 stop:708 length:585 start_codon:yes stop_codon:yes gene_type:complete